MNHATELKDSFEGSLGIAIIGMAARFPGAKDIDEFWENLRTGKETIHFFTDQELEEAGVTPAELNNPHYVKAAPILNDVDLFDAAFFDYTPMEASFMDPQQRLLLECSWQALEHAGYTGERISDSIGVYAGIKMNTYVANFFANPEVFGPEDRIQILMGNADFALGTRISYKLNLKGPSYMLQTACSTSLAAVHLACQALLLGECRMALAGAVAVEVPHKVGYHYQYGGPASPDGHCRSFDAQAQGTVFGSGVAMIVLKRLEEALTDGDHIYAVIRGTAVNNDGAIKASFTAPSVEGQTNVIMDAVACANVDVESISYVEAHGTATPLGDPIEIMALTNAFRAGTDRKGFCRIGSVKSNVGHLDAAAGMAGLIKTVLALTHKQIPASLYFEQPNPQIDFANSPFVVSTELTEWKDVPLPRRAGVSSFGFGGTNTHVILEEAPTVKPFSESRPWQLLLLSAKTDAALNATAADLATHLKQNPDLSLADVAYTWHVGRSAFQHRRMLVCRDLKDAVNVLGTAGDPRILTAVQKTGDRPVVFMFPGQGAQYVNMALELYQAEPVFQQQVDRCAEILKLQLGFDLRTVLYPDPAADLDAAQKIEQTAITQPALFVIEYALAQLWQSWGIVPQVMIGHSIGEYVAACLADVFSLEDALTLVAARGRLMQQMPTGAMLSVSLPAQETSQFLKDGLTLAASNGPSLCVVSGPADAISALEDQLIAQNIVCRRLHTSHAFHSEMMRPIVEPFLQEVKRVPLQSPRISYLSNVTGTFITAEAATDPQYWARHLLQTVRFAEGIQELIQEPNRILLEVGPGRTLGSLALQQLGEGSEVAVFSSLRHPQQQQSDVAFLLTTLGRLWLIGQRVDWRGFYANERRQRLPLPTYPFERRRFWVNVPKQTSVGKASFDSASKKADIADWFYAPVWKQSMPPVPVAMGDLAAQRLCWLVFCDAYGLGSQLADRLEQEGQDVVTVWAGQEFAGLERTYTIRPQQQEDYDALIEGLRNSDKTPDKIVHLWQVMPHEPVSSRIEFAQECQHLGFYSLIFLAQALAKKNINSPLQMGIVSSNMHKVINEGISYPEKATVLGPCRVIPREYPQITCASLDIVLPAQSDLETGRLVDQLVAELVGPLTDPVVAFRDRQRWIQALDPVRLNKTARRINRLRQGGTYLITGGLGGVGLVIAEYLARTMQAKLVLTRRSAFPPRDEWDQWIAAHADQDDTSRVIRQLLAMEKLGTEVLVAQADVTRREQMQSVVVQARERFGIIHGVIHAAGVAGGGVIQRKTTENAAAVLAPKVRGALVLDDVFKDASLDFMMLFSSLSAILGEFGQVDYCAANAFLDAFACHNTLEHNRLTLSINWDTWREVGMAVQTDLPAALQEWREGQIQSAILSSEGAEAFDRILSQSALAQIAVCTTDLYAMIERIGAMTQSGILAQAESLPSPGLMQARPNLQMPYTAPTDETEQIVADIWQRILGIEQVGIHDNFFDLGGHSLLALRIVGRLRDAFQVDLAIEKMFDAPTVAHLAKLISDLRANQEDQDALEILAMLSQLSEEEVETELEKAGTDPVSEISVGKNKTVPGPMTQAPRQLNYYAIVPHPTRSQVLMLSETDGWSLPCLTPQQHHFGAVNDINRAIQRELGLTVTVLRCADYDYDPETKAVRAIYATENHNSAWMPANGSRWIGSHELADIKLAMPEQRPVLDEWFTEANNGSIPEQRRPWARVGWYDAAQDWIHAQLNCLGLNITEPIEQVRAWGVSCVLRVNTIAGPLYFRAVPEKSRHEPLLLQALAEQYPTYFPPVLAIDANRHWVLMREVKGQPLLQVSNVQRWEEVVRTFAQIQIDYAQRTDDLLAWGCPDRRLDQLAAQVDPLFADRSTLQRGRFGGLSEDEISQLQTLAPEIKRRCAQLAHYKIPSSLEHGDLHPGNIQVTDDSHIYFDWGESSLAHPFFSLSSLEYHLEYVLPDMRQARPRLLKAYLEPWTHYEPMERLLEAVEFSRPLAALHSALTFYRIIASLEAEAKWEMEIESALPYSLRTLLHYMRHE